MNVENLLDDLELSYNDTKNKYGEKQATGAILVYLVKHDESFISGKVNRDTLKKYTNNDIGYLLIEHLIKKIGYEKDVVELGKHPDVDICNSYEEAKNIVVNLLIRYDNTNNKIAFGDILNIIKTMQIHENIKNYLVNKLVLDVFVNHLEFNNGSIPFTIKYINEENIEKETELNGQKIINYVINEYNLGKSNE